MFTYSNQQSPKVPSVANCQHAVHAHTEAVLNDEVTQPSSLWPVPKENFEKFLDDLYLARKERKIHMPTLCMKTVLPLLFLCIICPASALISDQKNELEIQENFVKYTTATEDLGFFFIRAVGFILVIAVICLAIYMVYRSILRIYLWWTKPEVLYVVETNKDQVVWCSTRVPASSKSFVDYRSQQRSARAAVTTKLANVTFPGTEKPIPICLDLIATCLEHFTGSTPTKPAIMNFMFTQTQFNLAPLEWAQHKLYVPSMVSWMLRQNLNKASLFWAAEEESIDYDEISNRDRKRKYRLFLHAFFGSKKLLTLAEIVVSWIVLGLGILVLLPVGGYILGTVAKIMERGSDLFPSDRKMVRIKDQMFNQTMGYQKPALKPIKSGFKWIKVPFNDSLKCTSLQSILPREALPEWMGYHYDRKDGGNMKQAIEQRVAVTNVVEDVYDPDYKLMHKLSDNLAELLINQSSCERVYPDRQVVVDWLESKDYPIARKVAILKAFDDAQSLLPEDLLKQKSGRVEAFIKEEFYPQFKNPRAILARGDLAKAILGPIFDNLNHEFFKLPQTVKKIPAAERPAYIMQNMAGPYYYVTDHTAFECSATRDIQENMEHRIYRRVLGEDAYAFVAQLLEDQKVTCGNGKCIVPASRFSGEMNTSLGNSIVNYIVIQMIQDRFNVGGNFFIEGDDGLLCFDKELDVEAVRQYALSQGFNLKIDRVESPGKAGFLSTFWDEDGYCYKHPLGKYLSGAAWRIPGGNISDEDLLLARLSSFIEENPRNALLVKLFNAFSDKYHSNKQTVSIYKPDDAYFREKLRMQGVSYVREHGMLKYERPRYEIVSGSKEFLLDVYDISDQLYDELSDMIENDPEHAYKVVANIFIHHEMDNFWQEREIAY